MPRLALLTGSPGLRREALAAELARGGWEVRRLELEAVELPDVLAAARGAEAVFHLGVRTSPALPAPQRAQLEAAAAYAVGRAARDAGARRFVHLSTVEVYGRPRNLPCGEGELKAPRTPLERARWQAEQAAWLAFRQGAPLTVLRPTLIYGPTLRSGPVRALALVALFAHGRRRVPIIRRGPVVHLVHVQDLARAAVHVAEHPDDQAVVGRAFNVGDDAPLPLAEHLAPALEAMGHLPGRLLPYSPRLTRALLWLVRNVPDRWLLDPLNRALAASWRALVGPDGAARAPAPRVDRESLHWMAADHYYDTRRLADLGWRPTYPISTSALPETIRALLSAGQLPAPTPRALIGGGPV